MISDDKNENVIKSIPLRMSLKLHNRLKHQSVDTGKSINEYILDLIDEDLRKKDRELMLKIARESREAFTELAK